MKSESGKRDTYLNHSKPDLLHLLTVCRPGTDLVYIYIVYSWIPESPSPFQPSFGFSSSSVASCHRSRIHLGQVGGFHSSWTRDCSSSSVPRFLGWWLVGLVHQDPTHLNEKNRCASFVKNIGSSVLFPRVNWGENKK